MEIDIRPWGKYEVWLDAPKYKVKRITVKPGGVLSYQYHKHRDETWVIVDGVAACTINDEVIKASRGDSLQITSGTKHRIANNGSIPLVFIEVQTGTYFGEDDIVRVDDIYGRAR